MKTVDTIEKNISDVEIIKEEFSLAEHLKPVFSRATKYRYFGTSITSSILLPSNIIIIKAGDSVQSHSCICHSYNLPYKKMREIFDMVYLNVEEIVLGNNISLKHPYQVFATLDIEGFKKRGYVLHSSGIYMKTETLKNEDSHHILYNYFLGECINRFIDCDYSVHNKHCDLNIRTISLVPYIENLPLILTTFGDKVLTLEELGVKSSSYSITEGNRRTFGVELETIEGVVPPNISRSMNISATYDGSLKDSDGNIRGGEYVTGVLCGDNGFKHLRYICRQLSTICRVDKRCGVHVHVSSDTSKESLVALYMLCVHLQKTIERFVPASRRDNEYCRRLGKIFTKKIIKEGMNETERRFLIDEHYTELFSYVAGTEHIEGLNRRKNHPKGNKCGYDHDSQRYCWVNFVPALFNTRGDSKTYTVEFRNHPGSLSYTKIKHWVKLCLALVNYSSNNANSILSGILPSFQEVIKTEYPKTSNKMLSYFNVREAKFSDARGDSITDMNELLVEDLLDTNSIKKDI